MGFDVSQVISDEKHYQPFVCRVCANLCDLDALVTTHCSHAFCRTCLEAHVQDVVVIQQQQQQQRRQKKRNSGASANSNNNDAGTGIGGEEQVEEACPCPTCSANIRCKPQHSSSTGGAETSNHEQRQRQQQLQQPCTMLYHIPIAAQSLRQAQPLAHLLLRQVQVACCVDESNEPCEWVGDYADFVAHAQEEHDQECIQQAFKTSRRNRTSPLLNGTNPNVAAAATGMIAQAEHNDSAAQLPIVHVGDFETPHQQPKPKQERPSMAGLRSVSSPSVFSQETKSQDVTEGTENDDRTFATYGTNETPPAYVAAHATTRGGGGAAAANSMLSPRSKFRKSNSLREVGGEKPISLSDLKKESPLVANRGKHLPTAAAPAAASSIETSPGTTAESTSSKVATSSSAAASSSSSVAASAGGRDGPPNMVHRTVSGVPLTASSKASPKAPPPTFLNNRKGQKTRGNESHSDLEVSYSYALDWNTSLSSLGNFHNSNETEASATAAATAAAPMETLNEDETSENLEVDVDQDAVNDHDGTDNSSKRLFDKAEKLKKQANAKFNKGDFSSARTLYSDGIDVMKGTTAVTAEERELLSNMHSNRGVTFFREKKFDSCIEDCDLAIRYDPTYDKSWIRKWRAHMALGDFDSAYHCLETANKIIPDSKKIRDELTKCHADKELMAKAREALAKRDYQTARDTLKPHSRTSDNIGLLFVAARADASLGFTESALEKVNKALRFNPNHPEGLELRGYTLFLSGETEKGAHLLQEACARCKDSARVKNEMSRCQKTHTAFQKGRACMKRGRYAEALDHLTNAISECGYVPVKAPLFGMLRVERAEAFLLCNKYVDACKDCQEVINSQPENAAAWSLRAEILITLGEVDQAMRELKKIRKGWGADNPTIEEGYRRVDFELRVRKADDELIQFVADMESGRAEKIFVDEKKVRRKSKDRIKTRSSPIVYEADFDSSAPPREKERKRAKSSSRRSSSRTRAKEREPENGRPALGERSRSQKKGGFVPPPSVDDIAHGGESSANGRPSMGAKAASSKGFDRGLERRSSRRSSSVKRT